MYFIICPKLFQWWRFPSLCLQHWRWHSPRWRAKPADENCGWGLYAPPICLRQSRSWHSPLETDVTSDLVRASEARLCPQRCSGCGGCLCHHRMGWYRRYAAFSMRTTFSYDKSSFLKLYNTVRLPLWSMAQEINLIAIDHKQHWKSHDLLYLYDADPVKMFSALKQKLIPVTQMSAWLSSKLTFSPKISHSRIHSHSPGGYSSSPK